MSSKSSNVKMNNAAPKKNAMDKGLHTWLIVDQPKLQALGLIILLCLSGAICPLSMDMYTPALPEMPHVFSTSAAVANLTLTIFYLFFSLGMLLFGPISDRAGRKPVLLGGLALFVLGGFLCAASFTIEMLIVCRAIQASGAGAVCSVSTAIVKDCFAPEKRTALLSILQVLTVLGPVIAPLLGGIILQFSTWHTTFVALAILGICALALSLLFKESLPQEERVTGNTIAPFLQMGTICKDKCFMIFLIVESFFSIPFMAYVTSASYIYVDIFAGTAQTYSYFFAATAAISMLGPVSYLACEKRGVTPRTFTHVLLGVCLVTSILLFITSSNSVFIFFICMAVFAFCESAIRPYATNILLAQHEKNAGAASSVINFFVNIFGVIGMVVVSLFSVSAYIYALAFIMFASMAIGTVLWIYLLRSKDNLAELKKR